MKATKLLALFLALMLVLSMFVACGGSNETESNDGTEADTKETSGGDDTSGESAGGDDTEAETFEDDDLGDIDFSTAEKNTITFFVRTGYEHEVWVEEYNEEPLNDASYRRTQTVQNRLGVTIKQINQEGGWSKHQEWNDTLRNAIKTTSHDFDAAMIYAGTGSSLAIEGCYMELSGMNNISLGKSWWNQNLLKEATIYDQLYFASGSIANSQLSAANVLWYNKDIYNEYFANTDKKDIYQVVRDEEWTLDYLYDLVAEVWDDMDTNGEHSSGDVVGFGGSAHGASGGMDSWLYALGCDLTKIDETIGEPVACFYDDHTVQAYNKLVNFYTENPGAYVNFVNGGNTGDTSFVNGNVMFTLGGFGSGANFREVNFAYGVLPVPKFDTEQETYRSIPEVTSSMVTILSTVESDRLDMVAATVELTAAEAHKQVRPVYVDVVLKSQQSNSPDDAEMVQLIIDSMVYSFGWIFSSTHMGNMGKAFRVVDGSRDLTQYYESNKGNYEGMLELLIDGFAGL